MPTVIDSFIVELGLDPSKFTAQQKRVIRDSKDWAEKAHDILEDMEEDSKKAAQSFGVLQTRLLGVAALVTTGLGLEKFFGQMIKQDAATQRLSYTLETSVTKLDKWRNAAYLAGGTGEGTSNFIQHLTSEFQKFAITGESSVIPYFRGLGVQISDLKTGKMREFDDIMRDLSNRVSKLSPAQGAEWLRSIGADEGTINLLIRGGDELDKYLARAEKFGNLTAKQAADARKLDESYRTMTVALTEWGRTLASVVSGPLTKFMDMVTKSISERDKNIPKTSLMGRLLSYMGAYNVDHSSEGKLPAGGAFGSQDEKEKFIRDEAAKRGINPDIAVAVAKSEGFKDYVGDQGTSFGAFQLHYKNNIPGLSNSGLGDVFTQKTGLDARDPKTERDQITFALDEASKSGWGAWHGWKGSPWAGINKSAGNTSTTDIKIGNINIYPPSGDPETIAHGIKPAIEKSSLAYQGQAGPQ